MKLAVELRWASLRGRVERVSLRVERGERVALLGPSGAGKSTILRLAAGLEAPDAGDVLRAGRVGWVPQSCRESLLPWRSVRENVSIANDSHRDAGRVARALQLVRLAPALLDARPQRLSGGEAQRVALARAMAIPSDLLLLDEPFSALDAGSRSTLGPSVAAYCHREGVAAVLVTHDLSEARSFAHRAVVVSGPPAQIVAELDTASPRFDHLVRGGLGATP